MQHARAAPAALQKMQRARLAGHFTYMAFWTQNELPFFGRTALGSFEGAAARDGAGATPPVAVVIRGGKKRLRARPMLGGAPAVARPPLPALGFPAAGEGSRLYSGVSGVPARASMGAVRRRRRARGVGGGEERVRRARKRAPQIHRAG
ncbi:hypothetical protein D1007_04288 [Hordeum vulgare]|nr:hypothetical protein D1007_04288 [Hordeum vulgare]